MVAGSAIQYVSHTEAKRTLAALLDAAQREPVVIRDMDRDVAVVLSLCRDVQDNAVLAVALDGKADLVVTGDNDLLTLRSFENIPIIRPSRLP